MNFRSNFMTVKLFLLQRSNYYTFVHGSIQNPSFLKCLQMTLGMLGCSGILKFNVTSTK